MTLSMKDNWTLREEFKKMGRISVMGTNKGLNSVRPFGILGKDILWVLHKINGFIDANEIADFLGVEIKSVSKALTRIMKSPFAEQFIVKTRSGSRFIYQSTIPKKTDIEEMYKLVVTTRSTKGNPMIKVIEELDKFGKVDVTFNLKGGV